MTRKHYEKIAELFAVARQDLLKQKSMEAKYSIILTLNGRLADVLQEDNSTFDRDLFMVKCMPRGK